MLTPVKHGNRIRDSFVLEQSWAPSRRTARWAPYASRWTFVFQHLLKCKIIPQCCCYKSNKMQWWTRPLGITYALNPLLQLSAFICHWMCMASRSENTPRVTLSKVFALNHCYPFHLKWLTKTLDFWKSHLFEHRSRSPRSGDGAFLMKQNSFPFIPMMLSLPEPLVSFALFKLLIVLVSYTAPLINPQAPVFI